MSTLSIWERLAAPIPPERILAREERGETLRYINGNTVRDRLDEVVPGGWEFDLQALPTTTNRVWSKKENAVVDQAEFHFLGTLTISAPAIIDGAKVSTFVRRSNVGSGRSAKTAASDAFKRCGVSFGIAHELYEKDAPAAPAPRQQRQVADPGLPRALRDQPGDDEPITARNAPHGGVIPPNSSEVGNDPACPKCGGRMFDNRATKRNPKAPDFKCRDRSCDGVIWPPKGGSSKAAPKPAPVVSNHDEILDDSDDIPF
jgi:hypothetical protein